MIKEQCTSTVVMLSELGEGQVGQPFIIFLIAADTLHHNTEIVCISALKLWKMCDLLAACNFASGDRDIFFANSSNANLFLHYWNIWSWCMVMPNLGKRFWSIACRGCLSILSTRVTCDRHSQALQLKRARERGREECCRMHKWSRAPSPLLQLALLRSCGLHNEKR